jgi:hypothetical protein
MWVGRDFDPSDPGENEVFSFDFTRDLADNEALAAATWTCSVASGTDPSASAHINGAATVSGKTTSQRVTGLLAGVRYRLQAVATTTFGNTVSLYSHVTCASPK